METGDRDQDTICAVSTPAGVGGIAVVRISGPEAVSVTRKIAPFLPPDLETHRIYYGKTLVHDGRGPAQAIDEVLVSYFKQGRSFTSEDTLEISCHGNPVITRSILKELTRFGARIADRGEFTYRAFMNGRLDLIQAESVLSLIQAQSELSSKQALRQLTGELSKELHFVEDELIWCLANIEAGIDFSTEGIDVVSDELLRARFKSVKSKLERLSNTYRKGRLLNDGVRIVFAGEPNVGKSSLLNLLADEDRAIVSEIAGTTRDTVEAEFLASGIKVVATDTAGLRPTQDKIEKIGIHRSYRAMVEADFVFYVFDASRGLSLFDLEELSKLNPQNTFVVGNKVDQINTPVSAVHQGVLSELKTLKNFHGFLENHENHHARLLFVSALDKNDGDLIKKALANEVELGEIEDGAVVSQARHYELLEKAIDNLGRAENLLGESVSYEFLAIEMKEALLAIQATIGKRFDDQILDRVFKEFCIGK